MPAPTKVTTVTVVAAVGRAMVQPRENSTRAGLGCATQHEGAGPELFWSGSSKCKQSRLGASECKQSRLVASECSGNLARAHRGDQLSGRRKEEEGFWPGLQLAGGGLLTTANRVGIWEGARLGIDGGKRGEWWGGSGQASGSSPAWKARS